MSQGHSRDKKKARSARKDRMGVNARRKANLPAKAGKRKQYTTGKRKVKQFPDGSKGFIMKERQANDPAFSMVFTSQWSHGSPVMVSR